MKAGSTANASTLWMASVLRNDPDAMGRLRSESPESFAAAASANGVLSLATRSLRLSGNFESLPPDFRDQLLTVCRREQGLELARRVELRRTLDAFAATGVEALAFKGAAVAYTHYPYPHLRPRVDTDLLVRDQDRTRAVRVLEGLGYRPQLAVERDAIFTQTTFYLDTVGHLSHLIDLHWRIANRPLFRDLFAFDELALEAVSIPLIGAAAKCPGSIHSLLLACIHPVAHHHCEWPLIWLTDVSLLAERLSDSEWRRFRTTAIEKKVSLICKRTFQLVQECFGPTRWLRESGMLEIGDERRTEEPSAEYLDPDIGVRRDLLLDLSASRGLKAKGRLLLSHAFPDMRYMREAKGAVGVFGTVAAYARRLTNAGAQLLHVAGGR